MAQALKWDLADSLARNADATFLGQLPRLPRRNGAADNLLETVLDIVTAIRGTPDVEFRQSRLDTQPKHTGQVTLWASPRGDEARTLETFRLLTLDGADGDTLVGHPFVTSRAAAVDKPAQPGIYFAADWGDAWVAVSGRPATVDTPVEPSVGGAVVIRASMTWASRCVARTVRMGERVGRR